VDLSQFLHLLRARRRLFWAVFGSIVAAAIAITSILPKSYLAEVQVIVNSKASDPITGQVMPQTLESANLATQIDVITSHNVATKVVDALHLASSPQLQAQFQEETGGAGSIRDWLADNLLGHLEVKPSRQSNMITIRFLASNAEFAAQGANNFADAYIQTQTQLLSLLVDVSQGDVPTGTGSIRSSSRSLTEYAGAKPAASSSSLRSRSGTSSCSARCLTMSALGVERPVSMKLRWRADTSASSARSICVMRRRCRQSRNSVPTAGRAAA